MPINTGIPDNQILNLANFCVDLEAPNDNPDCCPAWFVGPMLPTGTAVPEEHVPVTSYDNAVELFGEGSVLADMIRYYFLNCPNGELYATGLANVGATAEAVYTFTGPATTSGSLTISVGDESYTVPVFVGDGAADITQAFANAITNDSDSIVNAGAGGSVASATLTLTALNGGEQGNTITTMVNPFFGQTVPEGITVTQTSPFAGGGGTYDITGALSELGCCCFDFMVMPFGDLPTLQDMEIELLTRWDCSKLIGGHWYAPICGTFTELVTFNPAFQHGSLIENCKTGLYVPWQKTAAWAGRGHCLTCNDPTQRWTGPLIGIRCTNAKCDEGCFTDVELNLLALNGISVAKCGNSGFEEIQLTVTAGNYGTDQVGFFPQNYYSTIRYIRELKDFIERRYANVQIVDSVEQIQDGATNKVTIGSIVADIVAWSRVEGSRYVDNSFDIAEFIQIERNLNNPNRVDMCITIDLINALRVFAIKIRPRLNLSANI